MSNPASPFNCEIGDDYLLPEEAVYKTFGINVDLKEGGQHDSMIEVHGNERLRDRIVYLLNAHGMEDRAKTTRARIAELEARAPVVTEAQADALLQKVCGCYRCGRGAVGNEERCDQMLKLAHAEFAALAVTGTGDGWLPIETAPKDGTRVDVWDEESGRTPDCYFGLPTHTCGEAGQYCDSDWHRMDPCWIDSTFNVPLESPPTHWRPFPAAPSKGVE